MREHADSIQKEYCDFCHTRKTAYIFRGENCCKECKQIFCGLKAPQMHLYFIKHIAEDMTPQVFMGNA